jgi:hypothetical protein
MLAVENAWRHSAIRARAPLGEGRPGKAADAQRIIEAAVGARFPAISTC